VDPLVGCEGLVKRFGDLTAVDALSLEVPEGPSHSGGSRDPLCSAKRGSRPRSIALGAFGIEPNHRSPSASAI
jgi:hypothetical protein